MRALKKMAWMAALAAAGAALAAPQQTPSLAPSVSDRPFWDVLSYEEWTPEQAIKILTDSPWTVEATLVESGAELSSRREYRVQWYSARTLRESLVRLRHLQGRVHPEQDAEFLQSPGDLYQLYIFAVVKTDNRVRTAPLGHFEGITHDDLKQGTLLNFSSQEHRSRPDAVDLVREQETGRLAGIRLSFQRAVKAVPPAEARSGRVRLVCPTPRGTLAAVFDLAEMRRHGQPDL